MSTFYWCTSDKSNVYEHMKTSGNASSPPLRRHGIPKKALFMHLRKGIKKLSRNAQFQPLRESPGIFRKVVIPSLMISREPYNFTKAAFLPLRKT